MLDFLSTTDVGRRVPREEDDAVSAVSELEVQEWLEEQGAGRAPGTPCRQPPPSPPWGTPLFLPTPDFMAPAETE